MKGKGKMKTDIIILCITILGIIFLGIMIYSLFNPNVEVPLLNSRQLDGISSSLFDKPSPSNCIRPEDIHVYEDRIVIMIPDAMISTYAGTKSMDPTLDSTANGIEIKPKSPSDIHVGDIIAFKPNPNKNEFIVHRVIEIGIDEIGWYCITKGDNASISDPKIRFDQIEANTIGVLY